MRSPIGIRRVVLVILDGLRPDAIDRFNLQHLRRLQAAGSSTNRATTVEPSITTAAMTSLCTGVTPDIHGVRTDQFHIPRTAQRLWLLPKLLMEANYPVTCAVSQVSLLLRGVAARAAKQFGVSDARFIGNDAPSILMSTRQTLSMQRRGLIVMHWPDADRAGHAHGWMSKEYGDAAYRMDATLGLLPVLTEVPRDPGTLLILLSDHGGGGVDPRNHDSAHPDDRTIFVTLVGQRVATAPLPDGVSLTDVPPTILWALGVPIPASYTGLPLHTAFGMARELEPAVA